MARRTKKGGAGRASKRKVTKILAPAKVGGVIPINLTLGRGTKKADKIVISLECCGPYHQCYQECCGPYHQHCEGFVGPA